MKIDVWCYKHSRMMEEMDKQHKQMNNSIKQRFKCTNCNNSVEIIISSD